PCAWSPTRPAWSWGFGPGKEPRRRLVIAWLGHPLVGAAQRPDGRLEEGQAGPHRLGLLGPRAPGTVLGLDRRPDRLQRGEGVGHPVPGVLIRGGLAQRVQRLRVVIRTALD